MEVFCFCFVVCMRLCVCVHVCACDLIKTEMTTEFHPFPSFLLKVSTGKHLRSVKNQPLVLSPNCWLRPLDAPSLNSFQRQKKDDF